MHRIFVAFSVCSLALGTIGCGGGAEGDAGQVDTYETTGTVTYNGKPLADAIVSFSPKGTQPAALGRTDASGNYSLRTYEDGDGAAAGDYTVLVTKETVTSSGPAPHDPNARGAVGPASHSGGPGSVTSKSEIPEKYSGTTTSDLTATVTADGENAFNFDLKD